MGPFDPQVVFFGPCRDVVVAPDGTVTIEGIFNRLTAAGESERVVLDFSAVTLLTGGIEQVSLHLRLVAPDGKIAWHGSEVLAFKERHSIVGTSWRVRTDVAPGGYELRLAFDDGAAAVTLPHLVELEPG